MPTTPPAPIRRTLTTQRLGGLVLLDAVAWRAGGATAFRAFCATGTDPSIFDTPEAAAAGLRAVRAVSGAVILAGVAPTGVPALPTAGGTLRPAVVQAEWEPMAGRNAGLALRLEEPAETVADWLAWH